MQNMSRMKVRAIIGLILLYTAIYFNQDWIWSVLFLIWVIPDIFSGVTHFIDPVERKTSPVLYWIIIGSWLVLTVYPALGWLYPEWKSYTPTYTSQSMGEYQEPVRTQTASISDTKLFRLSEKVLESENEAKEEEGKMKQSLAFKTLEETDSKTFVGISTMIDWGDPNMEKEIEKLMEKFYNDPVIHTDRNLALDKVYVVYSGFDPYREKESKLTIGYAASKSGYSKGGFTSMSVGADKYAVFESNGAESEKWVSDTWDKISNSDLDMKHGYAFEIYELDASYEVTNSEIRVPIR